SRTDHHRKPHGHGRRMADGAASGRGGKPLPRLQPGKNGDPVFGARRPLDGPRREPSGHFRLLARFDGGASLNCAAGGVIMLWREPEAGNVSSNKSAYFALRRGKRMKEPAGRFKTVWRGGFIP